MDIIVVWSFLLAAFLIAIIFGAVITVLEHAKQQHRSVISEKEYKKFLSESNLASSIAHGGEKLCSDKTVFDLVREGSNLSEFVFPPINF